MLLQILILPIPFQQLKMMKMRIIRIISLKGKYNNDKYIYIYYKKIFIFFIYYFFLYNIYFVVHID